MVAALVFYLERIWTYTYFAPVITAIQGDFADGVAISQLLPDFEQWSRLNMIRTVVGDAGAFAALLLAAFTPGSGSRADADRLQGRSPAGAPRSTSPASG